ncbi:MAG: hypothetical protein HN886_02130 [Woeseiaceae bacterium]|jgi:GTP-binding protein HflX|nr:hypothetical protein [Woeseiaceae bacterium]
MRYKPKLTKRLDGRGRAVWISAAKNQGLSFLIDGLRSFIYKNLLSGRIKLKNNQGKQRAKLFEMGVVKDEKVLNDGSWELAIKITKKDILRFLKKEGMSADAFGKIS